VSIGKQVVILSTVDSTNKYAIEQVHAHMATHGTAYFALEQTQGRGQRGKTWVSEPGENIILTLVIEPGRLFPPDPFRFNAAIALACYDFFKKWGGDETSVKWPNDIYWRDRKAGGILIENIVNGDRWNWAIAGIGINVNQVRFDPALPNPVSLRQIRGEILDPLELAKDLLSFLDSYWNRWVHNEGALLDQYNMALYRKGEVARFKAANRIFEARLMGVNSVGEIVLKAAMEEHFSFGQVQWL